MKKTEPFGLGVFSVHKKSPDLNEAGVFSI